MLTLILLVVLGGGAGLAAVWLIDARGLSGLLGRFEGRSLRRTTRPDTTGEPAQRVPEPRREVPDRPEVAPEPVAPAEPLPPVAATAGQFLLEEPAPAAGATTVVAYEAVETADAPPPPSSSGRRDGRKIPAAYTAVEGSYRDVARVPVWRKLVSLVSLLGILLLVGVAIAALAGAVFGAVAELVDSAVG